MSIKLSGGGDTLEGAQVYDLVSYTPGWSINPELVLAYLQARWQLLEADSLSSEELDQLVQIAVDVTETEEEKLAPNRIPPWPIEDVAPTMIEQLNWLTYEINRKHVFFAEQVDSLDAAVELAFAGVLEETTQGEVSLDEFKDTYLAWFDAVQALNMQNLQLQSVSTDIQVQRPINGNKTALMDHDGRNQSLLRFDDRSLPDPNDSTCSTYNCYDGHNGIDYDDNAETMIVSATGGTVTSAGYTGYFNCPLGYITRNPQIIIQDGDLTVRYLHHNKSYVDAGQTVSRGQHIADVGSEGCSSGTHLHIDFKQNGAQVDPFGWWGDTDAYHPLYSSPGLTISEQSSGFEAFGAPAAFRDAGGDGNHSYFFNSVSGAYDDWGQWWAEIPSQNQYEVKAYIPAEATGTEVTYRIRHQQGEVSIPLKQERRSPTDPWVSLGVYAFSPDGPAMVILTDQIPTGEAGQKIYFDTIKWEPVNTTCPVDDNKDFVSIEYTSTQTDDVISCHAHDTLTLGEDYQILSPTEGVLSAGKSIHFTTGFEAKAGTNLHFCNSEGGC